jgi:uncharacterized protein YbjT (DUF2867 family)
MSDERMRILLTGATGYVGGRLLARLEGKGLPVRCLARRPDHLKGRVSPGTEIVAGDILDPESLTRAMAGCDAAYYLVHSMGAEGPFADLDRQGARHFAKAASWSGLKKIIYLGGLGDEVGALSAHLRSRQEVGRILRAGDVPVIEFRASIVIGSGSLSFEMIRALVERLPVMITPRWVRVPAQPIAIEDLLDYLVAALDSAFGESRVFAIGGADRVSYEGIMREYARQRGLKRLMIPVPILTPRLSGLWLGLVTPVYARIGRRLVDSLRHPTIVEDEAALLQFPLRPMGIREAIARALRNEEQAFAATRWSDALSSGGTIRDWKGVRFGSRIIDSRVMRSRAAPAQTFRPINRIGGRNGWYYGNALWRFRGWVDLAIGGVGMRRGRPDPEHLRIGDPVDWWRVESYEADRRLRLFAEMKLPGRAWLEFEVEPDKDGSGSVVRQTAIFEPVGLVGILYWYALYAAHAAIFRGMLRGIITAGERETSPDPREH